MKHHNLLILFLILIAKLSFEDLDENKTLINEFKKDDFQEIQAFTNQNLLSDSVILKSNEETLNTSPNIQSIPLGNTSMGNEEYLNKMKHFESKGLSTGGIIGIVVPCALALIGGIVAAALCPCRNTEPPFEQSTLNAKPVIIDSTMDKMYSNTHTEFPVQEIITPQIVPAPVEINHSIYNINKVAPPIPRVNRVFEPLYPSQKVVTVNQPVPTTQSIQVQQVVPQISKITEVQSPPQISQTIEVKQVVPQISKVTQVEAAPQISQRIYVPEPEPKIISTSQIVSPPQVLPETQTTQVNPSKVLPPKYLPKIRGETQVLPTKVLPVIDRGTRASSAIETIPSNALMQLTSSQMPLTSQEVVNVPVSAINEPITSQINLIPKVTQITQVTEVKNVPYTHVNQASDAIAFKSETHEITENVPNKVFNTNSYEINV
jgi:hypothetical protein